jgi:hypothetical protein
MPKGPGLITAHAGRKLGVVHNALLVLKSQANNCDYHDGKNFDNFSPWLQQQLLTILPDNSVAVLLNVVHRCAHKNRILASATLTKDRVASLERMRNNSSSTMKVTNPLADKTRENRGTVFSGRYN